MKKRLGEHGEDIFEDDGTPGADVAAFATGRAAMEKLVLFTLSGAIGEGDGVLVELAEICREFGKERLEKFRGATPVKNIEQEDREKGKPPRTVEVLRGLGGKG